MYSPCRTPRRITQSLILQSVWLYQGCVLASTSACTSMSSSGWKRMSRWVSNWVSVTSTSLSDGGDDPMVFARLRVPQCGVSFTELTKPAKSEGGLSGPTVAITYTTAPARTSQVLTYPAVDETTPSSAWYPRNSLETPDTTVPCNPVAKPFNAPLRLNVDPGFSNHTPTNSSTSKLTYSAKRYGMLPSTVGSLVAVYCGVA